MNLLNYQEHWEQLVDKAFNNGIGTLTNDEKVWFTVQSLIQSIYDGGLISFYYNSGADLLDETMQALEALECQKMIELMTKVNGLFPNGVPENITARNEIISSWPDIGSIDKFLDPIEIQAQKEANKLESKLAIFIQQHLPF